MSCWHQHSYSLIFGTDLVKINLPLLKNNDNNNVNYRLIGNSRFKACDVDKSS